MSDPNPAADLYNCFIQKQDTVSIPPLIDPQLQNAAFSVIEAAKSQLSELKLADLFAQQLHGDCRLQFISEFLYHWAGVDSKPPESMIDYAKKTVHSMIQEFLSTHDIDTISLGELICPLLPYLTTNSEIEELSSFLTRTVYAGSSAPEEGADMADLANLGNVISEVSFEHAESKGISHSNDAFEQIQAAKLRDIQQAFNICLNPHNNGNGAESESHPTTLSTTRAIFGSEAPTTQESDDGDANHTTPTPQPNLVIDTETTPSSQPE